MRTVEYELTVSEGTIEARQIGCTIIANDIIIDGQVQISGGGGTGSWGCITGDINRQLDLMQKFSDVDDDIEAEVLARKQAIIDEASARSGADTALDTAKTDKIVPSSAGNVANLDATGNLADSGVNLSTKADKVASATNGDLASLDSNGNLDDSGILVSAVSAHLSSKSNPHEVTKAQVGLGNVDNTSDVDKPVSTATNTELGKKADKVTSATAGDIVDFDSNGNIHDSGIHTSRITTIEEKIPTQASSSNQLADRDFVNSSIETSTATPRGTYNLINDLSLTTSATRADIGLALDNLILVADLNDYAHVEIPTSDLTPTEILRYEKYKYGQSGWMYEYVLPNSGFTSAQWKALNSNITAERETSYQTHINDGTIHVTTANKTAWSAKYDKPSTGIPKTDLASAVQTSLGKADTAYQSDDIKENVTLGKTNGSYNAPTYDSIKSSPIDKGTHCYVGDKLYKAKDDIATPPATFDETQWDNITIWFISENSGNDVHLSVVDGKLCCTFVVLDYDSTIGYEVGDKRVVNVGGDDVVKICIEDTPDPAGAYDSDYWEDYEE